MYRLPFCLFVFVDCACFTLRVVKQMLQHQKHCVCRVTGRWVYFMWRNLLVVCFACEEWYELLTGYQVMIFMNVWECFVRLVCFVDEIVLKCKTVVLFLIHMSIIRIDEISHVFSLVIFSWLNGFGNKPLFSVRYNYIMLPWRDFRINRVWHFQCRYVVDSDS